MKTKHLFASATIATALMATLPAQAQILGGGLHGAVSGMPPSAVGGGFATFRGVNGADLSASGQGGTRVGGLGRLERTAKTGAQEAGSDAARKKTDAVSAGRSAASAGEFEASQASDAVLGTSGAAARSTTAASMAAVGQGEGQVRSVEGTGAVAGAGVSGGKPEAGNSKPSAGQPVKPDRAGSPPHSSATHDDRGSSEQDNKHGELNGNASAAANASIH